MAQPKEELHIQEPEPPQADPAPEKKDSILSAPGNLGNAAGSKISSTLGVVGGPVGKGLETVAAPVGGLVEPLVGGVFRAPGAFGGAREMGKEVEEEEGELRRPVGGQEQTGENPLGLDRGGK